MIQEQQGLYKTLLQVYLLTSCQNLYYDEQLNVGARSFDIRGNATKDDASAADVKIIHGGEYMAVSGKRRK